MSVESTTSNLGLTKYSRGHSVRDIDLAENMDLIDTAIGGMPMVFMIPIVAGALADTDVIMTHKVRIIDAYVILQGAGVATTTLQVKNGTDVITDAMAASGSDTDIVRAATLDDAHYEIDVAGTLRVTSATGATQPAALVVVSAALVT